MKKRSRPNFLRHLEKRYGPKRDVIEDATRPISPLRPPVEGPQPRKGKDKLPRVYPINVRQAKPSVDEPGLTQQPNQPSQPRPQKTAASKGVIDMSIPQFVTLAIMFVLLAWVGSGAVAFGVVELSNGGPQGEMGLQGPEGERGVAGPVGPQGRDGDDAAQASIKRMATLWSVQQASALRGGTFVELTDAQVTSCIQYVLQGEGNIGACPGFSAGSP